MADSENRQEMLEAEDVLPILSKISILAGLSSDQLNKLIELLEKVSYSAGQKIFEQGAEPSYIYIVKSGKVKLIVSKDGTDLELIVFEEGHCFGEASIIGVQPHAVTAIATEETELIVLSRKALLSVYHMDLELFALLIMNIAREVCRRLHSSNETLLQYVLKK